MTSTKSLITSKTFWGVIVASVSPILKALGYDIGDQIGQAMELLVQVGGLILAMYGRVMAKDGIKGVI